MRYSQRPLKAPRIDENEKALRFGFEKGPLFARNDHTAPEVREARHLDSNMLSEASIRSEKAASTIALNKTRNERNFVALGKTSE
jgi:hypothetical protein